MYKEIQQQFNDVILESQGFMPKTDKLFELWEKNKQWFLHRTKGRLIVESKEEISFDMDDETKLHYIDEFIDREIDIAEDVLDSLPESGNVNSDVIASEFNAYISADYNSNKDDINNYFAEAKDFLNSVSGVSVKSYDILAKGVSKTVFENGVVVFVNETVKDIVYEDILVKSMSFEVR